MKSLYFNKGKIVYKPVLECLPKKLNTFLVLHPWSTISDWGLNIGDINIGIFCLVTFGDVKRNRVTVPPEKIIN